jgi:hypothetical protein
MDRELAQMVANTAIRARSELGGLIPVLEKFGDNENDEPNKMAIASEIYEIGLVTDRVFEKFPDLKVEFEARLEK